MPETSVAQALEGYARKVQIFLEKNEKVDVAQERQELESDFLQWCGSKYGEDASEDNHIQKVLAESGYFNIAARAELLKGIAQRQQQVRQERRNQRNREHSDQAHPGGTEVGAPASPGGKMHQVLQTMGSVTAAAATFAARGMLSRAKTKEKWDEVQSFFTQEEALRFVMECQPFDYRPKSDEQNEKPFPRFESRREALRYVLTMEPLPFEFVSVDREFSRVLRVREQARDAADTAISRLTKKRNSLIGRGRASVVQQKPQEIKPWVVEATGSLFTRPPSLRALRAGCANRDREHRYFLAIAPEVEKIVLTEGYRVQRRCSIPCSPTPQDALIAFSRNEVNQGRPPSIRAAVLEVIIPPKMDIDVISHKQGGFLIRARELPPSCFIRRRAPVTSLGLGDTS